MSIEAGALGQWGEEELLAAAGPVRRFASARLSDRHAVDDIVQEALARLLAARDRLDGSSLLPYAIVTARNLVTELGREHDRHRRHAHRVIDLREPDRPEEVVLPPSPAGRSCSRCRPGTSAGSARCRPAGI